MKFISTWTVPQGTFNAALARFLETGGAPPEGVALAPEVRSHNPFFPQRWQDALRGRRPERQ